MAYSDKVIDHYENPRNVGSFDKDEPNVGTGIVGAPECGDVMKLQLKISDEGVIEDARFKTFGCGSAIASSSYVTELVKGKTRRRGARDQEHADRRGADPAAGEDPLLGARRGRDQGGDRRLEEAQGRRGERGEDRSKAGRRVTHAWRSPSATTRPQKIRSLVESHEQARARPARQGRRRRLLGPAVQDGPRRRSATATRSSSATAPRCIVDRKSFLYLNGTELDYETA